MSINSSFVHPHSLVSNVSLFSDCLEARMTVLILTTFFIVNVLVVIPLCAFIFYLGYKPRRQSFSNSTAKAVTTHSDIFTYHILVMEMIMIFGCLLYCVSVNTNLPVMIQGYNIFLSTWCVKIAFHTLTCVERYLAVVHPLTYLHLKNKSGVRIRNIIIACVWLLCFVWWLVVTLIDFVVNIITYFCLLSFAISTIFFCCISVLCALRRSGPGKLGRDKERLDQMKQRAFNTVVTIMGVLVLWLGGILVGDALLDSDILSESEGCALLTYSYWFSLPSSLVLPLLYLHRAGKLPGWKR